MPSPPRDVENEIERERDLCVMWSVLVLLRAAFVVRSYCVGGSSGAARRLRACCARAYVWLCVDALPSRPDRVAGTHSSVCVGVSVDDPHLEGLESGPLVGLSLLEAVRRCK